MPQLEIGELMPAAAYDNGIGQDEVILPVVEFTDSGLSLPDETTILYEGPSRIATDTFSETYAQRRKRRVLHNPLPDIIPEGTLLFTTRDIEETFGISHDAQSDIISQGELMPYTRRLENGNGGGRGKEYVFTGDHVLELSRSYAAKHAAISREIYEHKKAREEAIEARRRERLQAIYKDVDRAEVARLYRAYGDLLLSDRQRVVLELMTGDDPNLLRITKVAKHLHIQKAAAEMALKRGIRRLAGFAMQHNDTCPTAGKLLE